MRAHTELKRICQNKRTSRRFLKLACITIFSNATRFFCRELKCCFLFQRLPPSVPCGWRNTLHVVPNVAWCISCTANHVAVEVVMSSFDAKVMFQDKQKRFAHICSSPNVDSPRSQHDPSDTVSSKPSRLTGFSCALVFFFINDKAHKGKEFHTQRREPERVEKEKDHKLFCTNIKKHKQRPQATAKVVVTT